MGFLDRAKAAAEQAAAKTKEGVQDVQAKRELGQAYSELGRTTFELAESGAISDPRLSATVERIRSLRAQTGEEEEAAPAAEPATGGSSMVDEPPTTPPSGVPG